MKTQSEVGYHKNRQNNHSATKKADGQSTNQPTNKFSKRSNIMNASTIIRTGLLALVSLFLLASVVFAGEFKNGGVINNATGKMINVKSGNFVNYTTSFGTLNNGGTLQIIGASKDFLNSDGTLNGVLSNSNTTNGLILISRNLVNGTGAAGGTVTNPGNIYVYFDYQNQKGITTNTGTIHVSHDVTNAAGTFTTGGGTVSYDSSTATGAQSVLGAVTYGTLNLHGGGTKTLAGDITAHTFDLASGVVAAAGTTQLVLDGTVTPSSSSGDITSSGAGLVSYTFVGSQTVIGGASTSYSNLTLSGAGDKTATGAISLSGNFTNGGSTNLITTNFTATGGGSTLTTNSGAVKASGTVSITGGTATTVGGTFNYTGTAGQAVAAAQYTNLTLSGATGTVTFPASLYVFGNYDPSGVATHNYAGSTIRFNGTGTQAITADASAFVNLEFYNTGEKQVSGGTVTTTGTVLVNSDVTGTGLHIMATGLLVVGSDLTNNGNITNDGTITVN